MALMHGDFRFYIRFYISENAVHYKLLKLIIVVKKVKKISLYFNIGIEQIY